MGWSRRVLASEITTLLCQLVQRLFTCLFILHDSDWRRLSFYFCGHRLCDGDMSCLIMYYSQ